MRLLPYVIGFLLLMVTVKVFNAAENGTVLFSVDSKVEAGTGAGAPAEQQDETAVGRNEKTQGACSEAEIQLLESLRHRREEIEQKRKEQNLDLNIMRVIDQSIDTKLQNLQKVQEEGMQGRENEGKPSADIPGLVKIYENMKPQDAAKIFDTLPLSVLLAVAEQMKESKLALVLATMAPEKAKELSSALRAKRTPVLSQNSGTKTSATTE